MSFECIQFEEKDNIGILTLSRPKAMNALNKQMLDELDRLLNSLDENPKIRCLVLTGAGEKAFVAGADIKEMKDFDPHSALMMAENGQRIFSRIENLKIASIAAVNGFALGGGFELALSCDFIMASENARFGLPEVSLGLIPGYGGTQRLSRAIGKPLARMFALTGDMFKASELLNWGLLVKVYSQSDLLAESLKMASTIASRGPVAINLAKSAINKGYDLSLPDGLSFEAKMFSQSFETQDQKEGVQAFIEKRKPNFTGQ